MGVKPIFWFTHKGEKSVEVFFLWISVTDFLFSFFTLTDNHDGLPPLQSVERGSKVTSSRAARLRRNVSRIRPFLATFTWTHITYNGLIAIHHYSKRGNYQTARRDYRSLCPFCSGNMGSFGQYLISVQEDPLGNGLIEIYNSGNNYWNYFHYYPNY